MRRLQELGGRHTLTPARIARWIPGRVAMALLLLAVGSIFSWVMLQQTGLARRIPMGADSVADWLVTRAFFGGVDPYTPLENLGALYGVPYVSPLAGANPPAPRLPGAFLVQSPMLLTGPVGASKWLIALGCLVAVWTVWHLSEAKRVSWVAGTGYLGLALISGIALWGFGYINTSIVIVGLMTLLSVRPRSGSTEMVSGAALAVAATLKVFPLILVFALVRRRKWVAVGWGVGIFLFLNLVPVLTPQVSVDGVVSALAQTFDTWFSVGGANNISMLSALDRIVPLSSGVAVLLQVFVIGVGLVAIVWRQPTWKYEMPALILLGLMGIAIVWPHYLLLALPFLLLIVANPLTSLATRVTLIGCTLLFIPARPSPLWPFAIVVMFFALIVDGGNARTGCASPEAGGMTQALHPPSGRLLTPTPWELCQIGVAAAFTPLRIWAGKLDRGRGFPPTS